MKGWGGDGRLSPRSSEGGGNGCVLKCEDAVDEMKASFNFKALEPLWIPWHSLARVCCFLARIFLQMEMLAWVTFCVCCWRKCAEQKQAFPELSSQAGLC